MNKVPIYEWSCPKCVHITETVQKYDDPPPVCVTCNIPTERILSACGWDLQGNHSGYYQPGPSPTKQKP